MKKKKVLFLIWSFTAGGGAEKILSNIVNNLDRNKYDISILEYENFDIKKEFTKKEIKILKPILINGQNKIRNKILKSLTFKKPKLIRKWFVKEKYDIEVAFNYMIPSLITSNSNNKKYNWVHSSIEDLDYEKVDSQKYKNVKRRFELQKNSFEKMNNIIAISNKTNDSIIKLYPTVKDKVIKIYNGYEFENLYKQSSVEVSDIRKIGYYTIVAIGRMAEQKNFPYLIDVADKLRKEGVKFNLFIIGDGDQRNKIEDKIRQYDLSGQVHLLGYINNPYPYLKQADLFCLTSIAEGFPTVLVEALALGCPFVSTDVAGAEELSNGEQCGLVSFDIDQYVSNVKKILENKELRNNMSNKGKVLVFNYSMKNQISQIEKLFDFDGGRK